MLLAPAQECQHGTPKETDSKMSLATLIIADDHKSAMRAVKAALLYADDVEVETLSLMSAITNEQSWDKSWEPTYFQLQRAQEAGVVSLWPGGDLPFVEFDPTPGAPAWRLRAGVRFKPSDPALLDVNSPGLDDLLAHLSTQLTARANDGRTVLCLADAEHAHDEPVRPRTRSDAELALASKLLGELPAFPDADIDVVLDIRDRLVEARTRFRAAMVAAATAFTDVPAKEFDAAVDAFRREHVDEALLSIRETLEDLKAGPTLLRVLSDKATVPTVAALAIAAAMFDPVSFVGLATSSAGVAAAAREIGARRRLERDARQRPYWYLKEVQARLSSEGRYPGR